jgi:hypothetical protein
MAERACKIPLQFYVTQEEMAVIAEKMRLLGIDNMSAYLRKTAVDGYIINVEAARKALKAARGDGGKLPNPAALHAEYANLNREKTGFTWSTTSSKTGKTARYPQGECGRDTERAGGWPGAGTGQGARR